MFLTVYNGYRFRVNKWGVKRHFRTCPNIVEVASYISCSFCLYTIMSPSNSHHIPINWLIDPIIPLGFPIVRWLNPPFSWVVQIFPYPHYPTSFDGQIQLGQTAPSMRWRRSSDNVLIRPQVAIFVAKGRDNTWRNRTLVGHGPWLMDRD